MLTLSVRDLFKQDVGSMLDFEVSASGSELDFPEAISVKKITGKVKAIKLEEEISIAGKFSAELGLICDRCLDNFDTTINFSINGEYLLDRKGQSGDALYVDKYGNINISEILHDELLLAVPTQNFCKEDCPGICPGCGNNLNHEACKCRIGEEIKRQNNK